MFISWWLKLSFLASKNVYSKKKKRKKKDKKERKVNSQATFSFIIDSLVGA